MTKLWIIVSVALVVAHAEASPRVETALSKVNRCLWLADGRLLAATRGGLVELSEQGRTRKIWTALNGLPGTRVLTAVMVDGALWVGTERGVARFAIEKGALKLLVAYSTKPVRVIHRHAGRLYIGTWGAGVLVFDPLAKRWGAVPMRGVDSSSEASRVTSLTTLGATLLAGTAGRGVWALSGATFGPTLPALKERWVWALGAERGRIWVATLAGVFSARQGRVIREGSHDLRRIGTLGKQLIAADSSGGLWRLRHGKLVVLGVTSGVSGAITSWDRRGSSRCFSTATGVWVKRQGAWSRLDAGGLPDGDIAAIAHDGKQLWVGLFDHGLMVLASGRWRRVGVGVIDRKVNAIAIDARRRVWVGTARGLHLITGEQIRTLTIREGLPNNDVYSLAVLSNGSVLVGTGRGAAIIRPDGPISLINRKHGLTIYTVYAVAEGPGGALLLGTSRGLYYRSKRRRWQRLSVASGHLADDWVTALLVRGQTVFVGTYNSGVSKLTWGRSRIKSVQLGGGWVNLAGLAVVGKRLMTATMGGLKSRLLGASAPWRTHHRVAPGRDVTAVAVGDGGVWIASRHGLIWRNLRVFDGR